MIRLSDYRIQTRLYALLIFSCVLLHELGHAWYEQGLPVTGYGLPLGEACSLSIHESQSRLWENCIGRGKAFWQYNYEFLQKSFQQQLNNVTIEHFYKAINKVQPSLIRTEADELTYHFHVMIRYEIEKLLIQGTIVAKDIPAYWNEHYKKYLGVVVPDDVQGCLQDVHWSHGSFGYFATYSIGSLYAAQFYDSIQQSNPQIETNISNGNTLQIKDWLQQNIYSHGRYYSSEKLCTFAASKSLNSNYFMDYATTKFGQIYGL